MSPHLADALHRVSVPSYVLDRDGNPRWASYEAAIDLVGDARGQHFLVLIAPEDLDRARAQFAERVKTGGARDFKVQLITADGGRATVEIDALAPMQFVRPRNRHLRLAVASGPGWPGGSRTPGIG